MAKQLSLNWSIKLSVGTRQLLPIEHACSSPKTFLLGLPVGAYTCMRFQKQDKEENHNGSGVNERRTHVLDLDFHIRRLIQSFQVLTQNNPHYPTQELPGAIKVVVDELTKRVEEHQADPKQAFLTVLLCIEHAQVLLYGLVNCPMRLDNTSVDMVLLSSMQTNGNRSSFAAAKLSNWISMRKPLEDLKAETTPPAKEVIMTTSDGTEVLEGLITNVFVISRGVLYTAQEHVLPGQMRQIVIEAAKLLSIPLANKAPAVTEIDSWDEVFLTSIAKPVCIVHKLTDQRTGIVHDFTVDGLAKRLQAKVAELL